MARVSEVGELSEKPHCGLAISPVSLLRGIERSEVMLLTAKAYAGRPPVRPNLGHALEAGSIVAAYPAADSILPLSANPKIYSSVVPRISIDVIDDTRIVLRQVLDQAANLHVVLLLASGLIDRSATAHHIANAPGTCEVIPRFLPDPWVFINVDQKFCTAPGR